MRVPILKLGRNVIATIQEELTDSELEDLRDDVLGTARRIRATGAIIDLTALTVVDSFAARTLQGIADMLSLLGTRAVMVGIQPEVAFAMVQLGLTLEGTRTALDLEDGLRLLDNEDKARE